jgi:hypothetical protein
MLEQSWLIDGKPAQWGSVFNVAHISVVGAIHQRRLLRGASREVSVQVFEIVVGPKTIPCCREDMGPEATENFRTSLIIAWGAELAK